ncbi:nucleoside deaminase [uncultured Agrococcus sp.]|uniref:nucleoside deaminase n=1 Tax=uncultured Agrococcus sp. TaxID=382258 RepID=UPI0025D5838A|nr:nucleoside deaminase [uncultured Agrococcus sp.]
MRVDPAYEAHMRRAMDLARLASEREPQDVPVGAVLLDAAGKEIASGANVRELHNDPAGHAELVAMRGAARMREDWHLDGCTLVVTLEPCPMCAGAIAQSRLRRVVFGAWDDKAGAAGSVVDLLRDRRLPHRVEVVGGVLEQECAEQLRAFFAGRRT